MLKMFHFIKVKKKNKCYQKSASKETASKEARRAIIRATKEKKIKTLIKVC